MRPWFVDINKVRTDYIVIENLDKWLVKSVPQLHPDHPEYIKFWSKETKKCIEGVWGKEFGKYRYMPGNLYFFGNYGVLEHTWKDDRGVNVTDYIKPLIVDYLWDFAYQSWSCRGFSGFEKDEEVSCNKILEQYYKGEVHEKYLPKSCINPNTQKPKKYEDAFDYLYRLHDKPKGLCLFENHYENAMTFGCLAGDTKIMMFDISIKEAKDIIVGDQLMGPDFKPRLVKDTFKGEAYLYTVTDSYGKSFICTGTHQLNCLRNDINGTQITVSKSVESILDDINLNNCTYEGINVFKKGVKNPLTISQSIGKGTYYGFEVDKDHLYLLEDGTITHNSRGGTKALLHGSKVQTPKGPVNIEDIKVGDKVFGQDGKPTKVLTVSPQGAKPIYEITFQSGRSVKCCLDHLWEVRSWNSENFQVKRTEELLDDFRRKRVDKRYDKEGYEYKYTLRNNKLVNYKKNDNLLIDPYLMGLLLGDGHISNHYTNKLLQVTCHQDDLHCYLNNVQLAEGVKWRINRKLGTDNWIISYGHNLKNALKRYKEGTHIYNYFEKLGLSNKKSHDKFIPKDYFIGDENQRLRLLQGLMDTDGYVAKRGGSNYSIYFCSSSKQLVEDVAELSRSLGIACGKTHFYKNEHKGCYKIILYTDNPNIFKLDRKRSLVIPKTTNRQKSRQDWDRIINITECGSGEATCISVDNKDKLFLTDNFVVTHNSFWSAIGELEYNFVFRCAPRYDETFIKGGYKSHQVAGSYESSKSGEMLSKFAKSQDFKTDADEKYRKWFGTWVEVEYDSQGRPYDVITPSPFYKRTLGTLNCPNTEKTKLFRAKYKVEINGEWKERGDGCSLGHVNYSSKKGNGERAAEGARAQYCVYEEFGSMENGVEVFGANEGVVSRAGRIIGFQHAQGTSGNIEYVQAAKKVFLNPQDYRIRGYKNKFSSQGKNQKIGYFIPFYITLLDHKDKNGNTDFESAIGEVNRQRIELANSDDPRVLRDFMMNKPCYVPEMWLTDKGYYLPYEEAAERERQLMDMQLYKELALPVEMYWDTNKPNNVWYKPVYNREPIFDWPLPKDISNPDGCVVIYEHPDPVIHKSKSVNKLIKESEFDDMYSFVGHDPYVAEEIDRGGSLGVTYILKNPKYIPQGHTGNIIVASYIGKPEKGLDYYYEQQEKLLAYYGNPKEGLWYEKNMGQDCRNYYLRKNKSYLLAPSPQYEQGSSSRARNNTSWGFTVGAHGAIAKKLLIKKLRDWLLEPTEMLENGELVTKQNIYRIPCIFLIRQIMDFNMEPGSNFDAVSGVLGCVVGLREYESRIEAEMTTRPQTSNFFKSFLENPKIFNTNKKYNNTYAHT